MLFQLDAPALHQRPQVGVALDALDVGFRDSPGHGFLRGLKKLSSVIALTMYESVLYDSHARTIFDPGLMLPLMASKSPSLRRAAGSGRTRPQRELARHDRTRSHTNVTLLGTERQTAAFGRARADGQAARRHRA